MVSWHHRHWLDSRSGWIGTRIDPNQAVDDSDPECLQLFRERRRRTAVLQPVLVAVPGAGDAAIDDPALTQGTVLMCAEIRYGGQTAGVAEDRNRLSAGWGDDDAVIFLDRCGGSGVEPAIDQPCVRHAPPG